jgi:pimeloyl-ACP methyl ester carboxylesterase
MQALTLRTADGLALAADAWLTPEPTTSVVVLVHGFAAHRRDPSVVAMAHDLRAAGHAVVSYDMRGHGDSEGLCTLGDREQLDVAAAARAARDLAPQVVIVGASLGAIAALRYAVADPHLAGVVTVSAPAQWKLRSPRAAFAAVLTRTGVGRRLARRLGARLDSTWRWSEPPDELAARLAVPLAVVHGTGDRFMPPSEAEVLHAAGSGADRPARPRCRPSPRPGAADGPRLLHPGSRCRQRRRRLVPGPGAGRPTRLTAGRATWAPTSDLSSSLRTPMHRVSMTACQTSDRTSRT